jgi:hypothetical protein
MQLAAMKDVTAAASALRQASASVKQLAQCRQAAITLNPFFLFCIVLTVLQARRMGPLECAAYDGAGAARD